MLMTLGNRLKSSKERLITEAVGNPCRPLSFMPVTTNLVRGIQV